MTEIEEHLVCNLKHERHSKEVILSNSSQQSNQNLGLYMGHSKLINEDVYSVNDTDKQPSNKKSILDIKNVQRKHSSPSDNCKNDNVVDTDKAELLENKLSSISGKSHIEIAKQSTSDKCGIQKGVLAETALENLHPCLNSNELILSVSQECGKTVPDSTESVQLCNMSITEQKSFKSSQNLVYSYQKENLMQSLSLYESKHASLEVSSDGFLVQVPMFNPPSKIVVKESMNAYNIPNVRYQQPYYSVASHVTGSVEIGHNILKIETKFATHLPEFASSFSSSLETANSNYTIMLKSDVTESNEEHNDKFSLLTEACIVTPVKLPPTSVDIYKYQSQKMNTRVINKSIKTKVRLPASPEEENEVSDDSLSVSFYSLNNTIEQEPSESSLVSRKGNKNQQVKLDN